MKWGGAFYFVKSGPFLNARCITYSISIFYFTFYLPEGAYAPNTPPVGLLIFVLVAIPLARAVQLNNTGAYRLTCT